MTELKDRLAAYLVKMKEDYQRELREKTGNYALEVKDFQHAEYMSIPPTSYAEIKKAKRPPSEERMEMIAQTYPSVYDDLGVPWMRTSHKMKRLLIKKIMRQVEDMDHQQLDFVATVSDQILDGSLEVEEGDRPGDAKFLRA
jgi:hypothetical protein